MPHIEHDPRVSIIIAAHNEGDRLTDTLATCLETAGDLDAEIIVADDASTDGSAEQARRRFPGVRFHRHERRLGASPAKAMGARQANGEVLVFLDGHTKPEPGAVPRLVRDVQDLRGEAIVTPAVADLDVAAWRIDPDVVGHGYGLDLLTLDTRWLSPDELHTVGRRGTLYESPALIGCALAISRRLYEHLRGFDTDMRSWGVEDIDLGLKGWMLGHPIVHDAAAVIGHRFRTRFDNYPVPVDHFLANQMRMAFKHYTHGVFGEWLDRCRARHPQRLAEHPEGLWARAWALFKEQRASADEERAFLMARRVRDEFDYADRFGLAWPQMLPWPATAHAELAPSPRPSKGPGPTQQPPRCSVTGITATATSVQTGQIVGFTATGANLAAVRWQANGGTPASGSGQQFATRWATPGTKTVRASCAGSSRTAQVTVTKPAVTLTVPTATTELMKQQTFTATVTGATATAYTFEIKRASQTTWTRLATGTAATYAFTARIAGKLQVRVTATVNGQPVTSPVKNLTVQFPAYGTITGNATVQQVTNTAWRNTKQAANATSRREEGFWIRLNTTNGTYAKTATILGPSVGPTATGSVVLGTRPADTPGAPALTGGATYTVASFHTHTPTTFRPVGRPVGPSGADNAADTSDDVTGIVYDYVESPAGSGSIPAGHPLNSPARRYQSGPARRSTPA